MAIRDIHNGQPGEWRGGAWFPDPDTTMSKLDKRVFEEHTRSLCYETGEERIQRISEEFGRQCREYNLRRAQLLREEKERRAYFAIALIVGMFVTLLIIHLTWRWI